MFAFKRPLALAVFVSAILWVPAPALANVIYSNFDSNFPATNPGVYATGSGYIGTAFTASVGGTLASIEFDLEVGGTATTIAGSLYTDAAGEPGTLLESWTVPLPSAPDSSLTVLTSVAHPVLSAGTEYFFVFDDPFIPGPVAWFQNDENINGGLWSGTTLNNLAPDSLSNPAPGIELLSTTTSSGVPEPGTGVLLGAGSLLLMGLAKVRRARHS
jgi:hypothetical protein